MGWEATVSPMGAMLAVKQRDGHVTRNRKYSHRRFSWDINFYNIVQAINWVNFYYHRPRAQYLKKNEEVHSYTMASRNIHRKAVYFWDSFTTISCSMGQIHRKTFKDNENYFRAWLLYILSFKYLLCVFFFLYGVSRSKKKNILWLRIYKKNRLSNVM